MRNLTIYRKSAMAGRLSKMNVFVENPNSNELVLLDRHYKKARRFKNGEAVYVINAKVFLIHATRDDIQSLRTDEIQR